MGKRNDSLADCKVVVSIYTVPPSLSLSFCSGSMPGTLVCSSLRSRQAYWAVPSTTQCDALLPLPFTPLSPLPFLCRGLMLSMLSTSICDTAARRRLTKAGCSGLPRCFPSYLTDSKENAPDHQLWVPDASLYFGWGELQRGVRGAWPNGIFYCIQKTTD